MNDRLLQAVDEALRSHGLMVRGGFNFRQDEAPPPGQGTAAARAILLTGSAGGEWWPHFLAWRAARLAPSLHPLDGWSRQILDGIALRYNARAAYPSDRPWLPFQQWAMRAEGLKPSPIGLLIHPEYGLWHAYRGALLFDRPLAFPSFPHADHPCDRCMEKPCLSACPVGAHGPDGFAAGACRDWLAKAEGQSCRNHGCLSRNACPVGTEWRIPPETQAFHQKAFAKA